MKKRYWKITGWDSTKKLFEYEVPIGLITMKSMEQLLKALAAKYLDEYEIISCYTKKRTKLHLELLEVKKSADHINRRTTFSCGINPYVVALVEEREED